MTDEVPRCTRHRLTADRGHRVHLSDSGGGAMTDPRSTPSIPVAPGHAGHRMLVNGHGNRWCDDCEEWAYFNSEAGPQTPTGRAVVEGLPSLLTAGSREVRREWIKTLQEALPQIESEARPTPVEPEARHLIGKLARMKPEDDWGDKFYAALAALWRTVKGTEIPAMGAPPHLVMADLIEGVAWSRRLAVEPDGLRATTRFTLAQALIGSELIARLLEYSKTDDDPRQLAQSWANRIGDWLDGHDGTWAVEPDGLPLDVERLQRALDKVEADVGFTVYEAWPKAEEVAAAYNALASTPSDAKP